MVVKRVINLKGSKLVQILREDKTGFCRLGHISKYINYGCQARSQKILLGGSFEEYVDLLLLQPSQVS